MMYSAELARLITDKARIRAQSIKNEQQLNELIKAPHLNVMANDLRRLLPQFEWEQEPSKSGSLSARLDGIGFNVWYSNGPRFDVQVTIDRNDSSIYFRSCSDNLEDAINSALKDVSKLGSQLLNFTNTSDHINAATVSVELLNVLETIKIDIESKFIEVFQLNDNSYCVPIYSIACLMNVNKIIDIGRLDEFLKIFAIFDVQTESSHRPVEVISLKSFCNLLSCIGGRCGEFLGIEYKDLVAKIESKKLSKDYDNN